MNIFTIKLVCPACNKEINFIEETSNIAPPLQGECPECKSILAWKREDMILTSFKPNGTMETPMGEVTIDPTWEFKK